MTQAGEHPAPVVASRPIFPALTAPYLRAPEGVRTIFIVTLLAACGPLLGGLAMYGWRAGVVAAIAIFSCAAIERVYYRVTHVPALLGRSHAYLTGMLLALTLPPMAPWYVPVVAAAFAIILGKAVFGGVGHFLWQPALLGRLAVAVLFASTLAPETWPVLSRDHVLWGDIQTAVKDTHVHLWSAEPAPAGADGLLSPHPAAVLAGLTRGTARYSALATLPDPNAVPGAAPTILSKLPPIENMLLGARGGGIGEGGAPLILLAGLYLIYRNYVKWQLPAAMLLAAAVVAAVAPVSFAVPGGMRTVWLPIAAEEADVGCIYVCYQLLAGGLMLAAFFLATEMTSRPVTTGGQVIFGLGCGALGMGMQLYMDNAIPAYLAVLAMNTFTPLIERMGRPRVLGRKRLAWLRG